MQKDKHRLDVRLTTEGYFPSREKARAAIMAGLVFVNGIIAACDSTNKFLLEKNVLIRIETILTRNYYLTEFNKNSEREVT